MTLTETETQRLSELAKRHLWMHMTRMGNFEDQEVPVIVRGEGPYVWDARGRRYLDALAGMLTVQVGHGRQELAEAAARQAEQLAFWPVWGAGHPPGIELAARIANLAPGDLNRVFFVTGGGEAVESAWKLARQYHKAVGQPGRYKLISRAGAWHGVGMGALALTGLPAVQLPFEPLVPGAVKVPSTNFYRAPVFADDYEAFGEWAADEIDRAIIREGAASVAGVILEPVQSSGGCIPPPPGYFQRVREICDRHGVLLISDEVICAFGRLGHTYGAGRYDYLPDMIAVAKGLTSGYSPLGALICSDRLMEPFLKGTSTFTHGVTFAGHPVSCAVALANLDLFEAEDILGHVRANEPVFRAALGTLEDLPIVGEVRGAGFFYAIELVKDKATRGKFTDEEADRVLAHLNAGLFDAGILCRSDRRVDPGIILCPPLICGPEHFDLIADVLRGLLTDAGQLVH